jgi:hypothetical protein
MLCRLFGSLLLMSLAYPCAAEGLPGVYRVVSLTAEVDGDSPKAILGNNPRGFAMFTPRRATMLITGEGRKFGKSAEERAALWDTLAAYSGIYTVDGNRFTVTVDVSANEIWNGTKQIRNWALDRGRLVITTERAPYSRDPSKMVVIRLVADRVE